MQEAATDYGSLTTLVKTAGIIISAVAAIGFAWRGRARWEPSEQDIPRAAQKVGGLLAAIWTTVMWTQFSGQESTNALTDIAVWAGGLTLLSLLTYSFLIAVHTYEIDLSTATHKASRKIIGGLWLTPAARKLTKTKTVQEILAGAAYDPDKVWERSARALAKQLFILGYLGLTVAGTGALTASAMLLLLFQQRSA